MQRILANKGFSKWSEIVLLTRKKGKTDEQIASEGLEQTEAYMREIGLVMNIKDLGVTKDMLDGIAKGSFIVSFNLFQ